MARCVKRLVDIPEHRLTSVIEFGNQRYGAKGIVPGTEAAATTKEFYQALGFKDYLALDVNTDMDAVIVDLNEPVPAGSLQLGWYDLVTNNGTGEHIFDQAMVFKNVHDLCKAGGIMLHVLPFSPWINHGFYCFQPILFRDLAAANGYEIVLVQIGHRNRGGDILTPADWSMLFAEKNPTDLRRYMQDQRFGAPSDDLLIGVGLNKMVNQPFRRPLQGKYQKALETGALRSKYQAWAR